MPYNPALNPSEPELDQLEDSISVKLSKKQGEAAIRLLTSLNLLNRALVPSTANDTILLPLVRIPKPMEMAKLEELFGEPVLARESFRARSMAFGSFEEVLARQIPSDIVPLVSKSFDIIGDIAIIELSPSAEPFEETIAAGLMQVHKSLKTVYSKAGPIVDSQRLRPLRFVLGERRSETIHKEHGCRFKVDVSKSFFSPRLSAEHERIAEQVQPGECVIDMFAGVGPFSVLIAKRLDRVSVHAVDSNKDAAKLVKENAKLNRVQDKITVWAEDARTVVEKHLSGLADRVIMNHPSQAKNFLKDARRGIKRSGGVAHYYTFADGEDCEFKAREEFLSSMADSGWKIDGLPATHRVRGVGPMKWQIAIDAKLVPA